MASSGPACRRWIGHSLSSLHDIYLNLSRDQQKTGVPIAYCQQPIIVQNDTSSSLLRLGGSLLLEESMTVRTPQVIALVRRSSSCDTVEYDHKTLVVPLQGNFTTKESSSSLSYQSSSALTSSASSGNPSSSPTPGPGNLNSSTICEATSISKVP